MVNTGGGGGMAAVIVGAIAIIAILYVIFGTDLPRGTQKIEADVRVETPARN